MKKKIILKRKSYIGHVSKAKLLGEWLNKKGISNIPLCKIKSRNIYDFSVYLAETRDLDKSTCEKYRGFLNSFFSYAKKMGAVKKKQMAERMHSTHAKKVENSCNFILCFYFFLFS